MVFSARLPNQRCILYHLEAAAKKLYSLGRTASHVDFGNEEVCNPLFRLRDNTRRIVSKQGLQQNGK